MKKAIIIVIFKIFIAIFIANCGNFHENTSLPTIYNKKSYKVFLHVDLERRHFPRRPQKKKYDFH